ncbi:uncharacterized protein RHO25_004153 [Cercospora beticola]|uniref:Uncharacterized protein n=2 Tax=Cercospora beticola TaxID=122368 RepID=A0ABZ0NJ26_CERBT|nr:hypothetical protein RHO25_004153 [Cercospora beticola]
MIRALLRFVWKAFKWPFLLTLPATFLPLLVTIISGISLAFWFEQQVTANTDRFLYDVKDSMSDWGVGGDAPSFRQFQDTHNDFHTMRINSNDFLSKLDFMLPQQYYDEEGIPREDLPIDKYPDIENLVRDISPTSRCSKPEAPREQWVFLTYSGFRFFPWDSDFIYAINYAQGDRKLNQTGLYFAQCSGTASFLCGVWNTRSPALVHFLVEEEEILDTEETGFTYRGNAEDLRSVTVRLIEFPLKDAYTGLPWTTFPSFQNQMLSIMTGDRLYEQFEPYDPQNQAFERFGEYMNKNYWDNKNHILYHVSEAENWMDDTIISPMLKYLDAEEAWQMVFGTVLIGSSSLVALTVLIPLRVVKGLVGIFLGKPLRGDEIMGDMDFTKDGEPANILADLFGGFMDDVLKGAESFSSKSVKNNVFGTTPTSGAQSSDAGILTGK